MSVLMAAKFRGDTARFRRALVERADELAKFSEMSQSQGAIHHRFGVGDGFVLVIDEWESPEHFEKFFANPDLQALIGEMGADPASPPEITFVEAVASPDQY